MEIMKMVLLLIQLDEDSEYTIDLYNFHVEMLKMDSNEPVKENDLDELW